MVSPWMEQVGVFPQVFGNEQPHITGGFSQETLDFFPKTSQRMKAENVETWRLLKTKKFQRMMEFFVAQVLEWDRTMLHRGLQMMALRFFVLKGCPDDGGRSQKDI